MNRLFIGYFTAGLLDVLIGGAVFCFPYAAAVLGLGTLGTTANALFGLTYVLVCLLVSRFGERLFPDRRILTAAGCLLTAAGSFLMLRNGSAAGILLSALLFASGAALFYPALQSWITEGLDRRSIVSVMSGYAVAWVTGYLLGPFLSGGILSFFGPEKTEQALRVIFASSGLLSLATLLFFLRRTPPLPPRPAPPDSTPQRTNLPQSRIRFFILLLWINNFAAFFMTGLIRFLFTELAKAESLPPLIAGSVTTLLYLVIIPATLLLKRLTGWMFSFGWLIFFQLLALPAVLFLALTRSVPLYFASAVLFGILSAFSFYASSSYSLMIEGRQSAFISINESVIGAGAFASAATGVLLADRIGLKNGFLAGLAVTAVCLAAQIILFLRERRRTAVPV